MKATYLEAIQSAYPDLKINDVVLNSAEGQYNDILIINKAIIFRFPKFAEGIKTLQHEVDLLTKLQGKLPLPIPNPTYASIETDEVGSAFMGYEMLPGEPLWRERFNVISSKSVLDKIAAQLASFLRDLHAIPLAEVGLNADMGDRLAGWRKLYADFQEHLFKFMRPDAQKAVTTHFEDYLANTTLHQYEPVLCHGDFGSGNILFDADRAEISGIIDFGFAGVADPAIDIGAAMMFGDDFFQRYCATYLNIEPMVERANFYRGTYALQEALYGIKNNNENAFQAGIAEYQ